ncbi:alpha/beta hydrolase [Clostridium algoriphilum]|uniref:alpha/beta hydrolase n=1 Tax=Clostridium algoriphilum TaxID=198347 RepID=UPI001CF50B7B|nr:alpha/beta hydrolase [Clostridium algoriphilum]MCB2292230.1 alpha/beta hydrolase [Clostridium algoriphilum]
MFKIIILIVILIIITVFIVCWHFSNIIIHPKVAKYNYTYNCGVENGEIQIKKFIDLEKLDVYIESQYGYKIHGLFFPNYNSKKAIILCHGITWSLYGSVKYMNMFINRGFSVFMYDHRNHGLSGGLDTSYGYYEKFDLKKCTDWLFNKLGKNIIVGLHGESMGAGIALQNIAIDNRIKFCIEDCGYSDAQDLFQHRLEKDYNIKKLPLVKLSGIVIKIRIGWKFKDVSPITTLPKVNIPILFIHGANDDYVPTFMCLKMYSVKNGYKDIYIAPNAGHAQSYLENKDEYEKRVDCFLKAINII